MKPHGALNTAVAEVETMPRRGDRAGHEGLRPALPIIAIAGSRLHRAAERLGQPVVAEGFPDRGYAPDGSLAKRGTEGAIVHDAEAGGAARGADGEGRARSRRSTARSSSSRRGTLCIHGDNPGSVATAKAIRAALEREGITIAAF